ncbi:MAG: response regulator [Deltaproteobacteria bacterium]|nr:response regulator [Deltaproteobacteria bacterium]
MMLSTERQDPGPDGSALASRTAYELGTPLSLLLGNLELVTEALAALAAQIGPSVRLEQVQEAVRDAKEAARRTRELLGALKRSDAEAPEIQRPLLVDLVAESALRVVRSELRGRAHVVRDYRTRLFVRGSELRLGQVLVNLLVNAAQAIPPGFPEENEVRLAVFSAEPGWVTVTVTDTGLGIAQAVLPRIFEPFFTTKPPGVGTGLGLPIAQQFVTELGGTLQVRSEEGVGTTVELRLPAIETEGEDQMEEHESSDPVIALPHKPRILVVDDEVGVGKVVVRLLVEDYEVVALTRSTEALARLHGGERFDLVIADLAMPELTGVELYQAVLAFAPEQAERFVFVSGAADWIRARQFLESVPNPLLEKPFTPHELRTLVARHLK